MFDKIKYISLFSLIITSCSSIAMERFKIAVQNQYGAPIEAVYTYNGKKVTTRIAEDSAPVLGFADSIEGDIVISRSGAVMGHTAKSWQLQRNALWQIWEQQRRPDTDTLLLKVGSAYGGAQITVGYGVTEEKLLNSGKKLQGDVLDQFPGLAKYKLTPAQIINIQSWRDVVVPGGWLAGAATGEDIARYIVGLPKKYDKASLDRAYRELALQWAPDKQALPAMKEFATKVMQVINHARDLLNDALREKGQ